MRRGPGSGSLKRVKRGKDVCWIGQWTDAQGQRHRKRLGVREDDARRALAKLVRERDLALFGLGSELGRDLSFSEAVDAYLASMSALGRTPKSVEVRRTSIAMFAGWLRDRGVRNPTIGDVTAEALEAWRLHRLQLRARATVNNDVLAVQAALRHARRVGMIAVVQTESVRLLPLREADRTRQPHALTDAEIERLLQAADDMDEAWCRPRPGSLPRAPLLRFLIETGVRWGEAVQLEWTDVDLEQGVVRLRAATTKTGAGRALPIGPDMVGRLQGLPHRSGRVFRTRSGRPYTAAGPFRRWLRRVCARACVSERGAAGSVTVHSLRHTFATRLLRRGVSLPIVMYLTGHRSPRVLLRHYAHLQVEDARAAMAQAGLAVKDGSNPATPAGARDA